MLKLYDEMYCFATYPSKYILFFQDKRFYVSDKIDDLAETILQLTEAVLDAINNVYICTYIYIKIGK